MHKYLVGYSIVDFSLRSEEMLNMFNSNILILWLPTVGENIIATL